MIGLSHVNFDDVHTEQDFLMYFPLFSLPYKLWKLTSVTVMIWNHKVFEGISYAKLVCSCEVLYKLNIYWSNQIKKRAGAGIT